MNAFVVAAIALLVGVIPCAVVAWRGQMIEAVVAYEAITDLMVMALILLCEGFGRSGEFELAVILAILMTGGGLVFVRTLERWL
ncbi:MAG TPA: hypothetical protein VG184_08785 [Acidimicrobiales bacterium]|jgi:hypothetical protein|nr:hypothetical protein [Acidimicrobiales bacterium]